MRSAAAICSVGGASVASWAVYDKLTCHPMRKYSKHTDFAIDSATRFRNLVLAPSTKLSLKELRRFSGFRKGREAENLYFGCRGWVYDASSSDSFRGAYIFWAGRDAT